MVTRRLKKQQSIDDNSGTATTFSSSPSPSSSSSSSYSALACARSIRTARGRRRWRRLQLAAVAFLVLLPNNKSSNLTFATTTTTLSSSNHEKKSDNKKNIHAWTICHSNNNNNNKNHKEENEEESTSSQREWIPPSQWDPVTLQRECFLERFTASTTSSHGSSAGSSSFSSSSSVSSPVVVTISAPGTALFQHWLSDHSSIHNHTTSTTPKNSTAKQFNPWNDFPTQETMQSYPDIGTINDDYYTLWYTTRISIPSQPIIEKEKKKKKKKKNNYIPDAIIESDGSSNSQKILVTDSIHNDDDDQHDSTTTTGSVGNIQQQQQQQQHQQHENKQRKLRGHLTMQGVNYLPLVHLDGKLIGTYSSHAEDEDASSSIGIGKNVGGMFLRRHYDLGIWNAATITTTSSLPLEILVLPPPVVGNPATTHSHDSTAAATTSATTQQATMKKMNMEDDQHLSPQLRNRNPHFDHPHDSFHSMKQKSPSFHQQPQPKPKQEPEGQGGDHNLAQSGAIMQCTAGWDWISSTPDRNTGIWDQVEIEWVWGDVRLHDVWVKVVNVTMRDHDNQDDDDTMELPLGDDVVVSAWLDLSVTATYHPSIDDDDDVLLPVEGELEYLVNEYTSPYSASSPSSKSSNQPAEPAILASGTIHNITITNSVADYHLGQIHLPSAKLWWPHTHGSQPLYSIKVVFRSYDRLHSNDDDNDNSTMSPSMHESQSQSTFGIRTISSYTHPKTKSFALRINGHSIFLQGGNWITTDQFLRYSNSPQRYFHELRLLCNVGLNSLRVWGGGIVETQHFYHAADVLGLLIYQEFWMTGDNNGRFAGDYDWPLDHEAYLANARDVMIRMRNHPSLAWYGGGNELYPIPPSSFSSSEKINGVSPPQDIEEGLQRLIAKLDGTRPYVTSSVMEAGDDDTFFDPTRALGPKDGAYGILNEHRFFERNPGLTSPLLSDDEIHRNLAAADVKDKDAPGRNIGFQTETGSVSHPDLDSLQKFLSPEAMGAFPDCGEVSDNGGSVHEEWAYFKYLPFTETSTEGGIDHICAFLYPPSNTSTSNDGSTYRMESIEDYTWAAQLAQYFQYKALFEGYSARMWKWYSAVYIWKSSSPAPTFRGALYDWYLSTNGGYWGAQSGLAGGNSVKLVLNLQNFQVSVVNSLNIALRSPSTAGGVDNEWGVRWRAYSMDGVLVGVGNVPLLTNDVEGDDVAHLDESLPWLGKTDISKSNLSVDDMSQVLLYKFEFDYLRVDRLSATTQATTASNMYLLTDPSISVRHHRQARFSLLGAMRKVVPRVDIYVQCRGVTSDEEVEKVKCTLQNPVSNIMAIMTKLTLLRDSPPGSISADHILPAFFSNNYITLIPGEIVRVDILVSDYYEGHVISSEKDQIQGHDNLWQCNDDGYMTLFDSHLNSRGDSLLVSVDGWNVLRKVAPIECESLVFAG